LSDNYPDLSTENPHHQDKQKKPCSSGQCSSLPSIKR
jgi:hypothetical protein